MGGLAAAGPLSVGVPLQSKANVAMECRWDACLSALLNSLSSGLNTGRVRARHKRVPDRQPGIKRRTQECVVGWHLSNEVSEHRSMVPSLRQAAVHSVNRLVTGSLFVVDADYIWPR